MSIIFHKKGLFMRKYLLGMSISISYVTAATLAGSYVGSTYGNGSWSDAIAEISADGKYMFLSSGTNGFRILNIENPKSIKEISNTVPAYTNKTFEAVKSLKLSNDGKYLYVGNSHVYAYDVSDKLNPKFLVLNDNCLSG
jgi:hypothetical protein